MFLNSLDVGRDFCKTMMATSLLVAQISVEAPEVIELAHVRTINRRYDCTQVGAVAFVLGVMLTLVAAMYFFSLPGPALPASMSVLGRTG
jgi:hypothetical protein